ncbi:hypothetical protein M8A51_25685 [Schlegelella sp. S2-27]|uniref:Uncharacterized protein n=1 Tax=Caldimonas mangrovi TaxID=2944811 RepID=A0ABT0YVZ8_9BURK|nr:hypothetical protein [Caldimonas mangrovi]MCM5682929.1 hypothetical protein [Caldimonas mangrovi]
MSELLAPAWQQHVASTIAHYAELSHAAIQSAAAQQERPSVLYRPAMSIDGNQWCALYGDNLQDGVAGFGASPSDAMHDFDRAWDRALGQ